MTHITSARNRQVRILLVSTQFSANTTIPVDNVEAGKRYLMKLIESKVEPYVEEFRLQERTPTGWVTLQHFTKRLVDDQ